MNDWNSHFLYSENSKSGLVWINDRLAGFQNKTINAYKGDIAGSINNEGHWMVYHVTSKRNIGCHRIIYEIHNGDISKGLQIDHIDGNRSNNSITNLRLVLGKINSRNQKKPTNNTSGVRGVYWNLSHGLLYAVAMWNTLDGKRKQKYFSAKKLGKDEAFEMACDFREKCIFSLNEQGAGYSERHGT